MYVWFQPPEWPEKPWWHLTLARCALDKFGGDSMLETTTKFQRISGAIEELFSHRHDLSHRKIRRPRPGELQPHPSRPSTTSSRNWSRTCSNPCTPPMASAGRAANRNFQTPGRHRRDLQRRPQCQTSVGESRNHSHRRQANAERRLPEHSRISANRSPAQKKSRFARRT